MTCTGLTDAELAYMRATQLTYMTDLCTRRRRTAVPNGYGGVTYTTVDAPNLQCRAHNNGSSPIADVAGAERNNYDWIFTFPWDQDIRLDDLLLYGGLTIEVKGINTPGTWVTALRVGGMLVA